MQPRRAMLRAACGLVWACVAIGCAAETVPSANGGGPRLEAPAGQEIGPDAPWPFWPQRMRVHPLTQFVTDRGTGDPLIEVRVEFVDASGYTCRAVGLIDIDLHDADAARYTSEAIMSWNANLWDLEVNHERYDDVTRTYLFRLRLDDNPIPREPELRVYFLSGDGNRLQASYRIPPP